MPTMREGGYCTIDQDYVLHTLSACISAAMCCRFFALVNSLSNLPESRESLFLPYNSHYIVAVLSPILFIVMIVMSILMMVLKNKWGPYITVIMIVPVSSSVCCLTEILVIMLHCTYTINL